jgi:hypothetical protein
VSEIVYVQGLELEIASRLKSAQLAARVSYLEGTTWKSGWLIKLDDDVVLVMPIPCNGPSLYMDRAFVSAQADLVFV